jgi:hypothetical protein
MLRDEVIKNNRSNTSFRFPKGSFLAGCSELHSGMDCVYQYLSVLMLPGCMCPASVQTHPHACQRAQPSSNYWSKHHRDREARGPFLNSESAVCQKTQQCVPVLQPKGRQTLDVM